MFALYLKMEMRPAVKSIAHQSPSVKSTFMVTLSSAELSHMNEAPVTRPPTAKWDTESYESTRPTTVPSVLVYR